MRRFVVLATLLAYGVFAAQPGTAAAAAENAATPIWQQSTGQSPDVPTNSTTILFNRNYQDVPLSGFPGVTVAHLDLDPGSYAIQAKFRYRNVGAMRQTASCVYQGQGIGGLDSSQQNVDPGGEVDTIGRADRSRQADGAARA